MQPNQQSSGKVLRARVSVSKVDDGSEVTVESKENESVAKSFLQELK